MTLWAMMNCLTFSTTWLTESEGRANIWDDSDVQRRLAELGVQTPQSTQAEPADVAQDTAPEVKEGDMAEALPSKRGGKNRLQDALEDDPDMMGYHAIAALYADQRTSGITLPLAFNLV
jgi:hypothetical protein